MSKKQHRLGPHSRVFRRGVIGASIDGRSTEGRYLLAVTAQLAQHVGGNPSVAQTIIIERVAKVMLRLDAYDAKLAAGTFTELDGRIHNSLHNTLLRGLKELGLKAAAPKAPTLAELLRQPAGSAAA